MCTGIIETFREIGVESGFCFIAFMPAGVMHQWRDQPSGFLHWCIASAGSYFMKLRPHPPILQTAGTDQTYSSHSQWNNLWRDSSLPDVPSVLTVGMFREFLGSASGSVFMRIGWHHVDLVWGKGRLEVPVLRGHHLVWPLDAAGVFTRMDPWTLEVFQRVGGGPHWKKL